ncbi:helix-turn-helix transcriptional regulator [Ornithinibacillus salinisoli]|uniref:Helix-turn-helix transcriptional regulator n=1 Tax=Ornithinibacillus salinisoli TaxID=1848459 RepID=A0ABW4VYL8_9BACI
MSKADNMLAILWLLRSKKRITAQNLADELELNIRTVYRYIDALCASGVPIIADSGHHGGYRLLHEFVEAPLFFNSDEQKALVHAARFALGADYPYGDALDQAISKLKKYTNDVQRDAIERHSAGLDVIQSPFTQTLQPVLEDIEKSVASSLTLEIIYQKEHDPESSVRSLDPYGLVFWIGKWYVVGHCHLRKAVRNFRVDRIHGLRLTDKTFERPKHFEAKEFFLKNLLPTNNPKEELIDIRIEGHPQTLKDLHNNWFLEQLEIEFRDHEIFFQLDKKSTIVFLPHILLSYGKSLNILEPKFLKERLVDITADLHDYYQSH